MKAKLPLLLTMTFAAGWLLCSVLVLGCGGETTTAVVPTPGQTDATSADAPSVPDSAASVDTEVNFDQVDALVIPPVDGHVEILQDAAISEASIHETSDADAEALADIFINPPPCKSNEECQSLLVPGTQCQQAVCVEGVCETEDSPDNTICDPENQCVVEATCINGECQGSPLNCDDFNPCTTDGCSPELGCTYEDNTQSCDDGNACTSADACSAGVCVGNAVNCNDSNPCTDDTCDANLGCKATANAAPCDDDNPCTIGDACKSGQCAAGTPKTCATDNGCAVGACSPVDGKCKFGDAVDGTLCNDGNACSESDACKNGLCVGKPVVCDDANPCTQDGCEPKAGCTYVAAGGNCDLDDNACTADQCTGGLCVAGLGKTCDDDNPCTADKCEVKTGQCVYDDTALEGVGCDADNSLCTVGDVCKNGQCVAGKGR